MEKRNCSLILFSTIFCYLFLDFHVKTGTRISLRYKRLFEISEVEITRVDCISVLFAILFFFFFFFLFVFYFSILDLNPYLQKWTYPNSFQKLGDKMIEQITFTFLQYSREGRKRAVVTCSEAVNYIRKRQLTLLLPQAIRIGFCKQHRSRL